MALDSRLMSSLAQAVSSTMERPERSSEHRATVVRFDQDGKMWVSIPGGAVETPVKTSYVSADVGDTVSVTISRGSAIATGNVSSPAATSRSVSIVSDDVQVVKTIAEEATDYAVSAKDSAESAYESAISAGNAAQDAWDHADSALTAAGTAWDYADSAHTAASAAWDHADAAATAASNAQQSADNAQRDAATANRAANGALAGLGTLESVIDTVDWFAAHKVASTDTTVQAGKTYYTYDATTGTLTAVEPEGSENPSQEGWWELDETIQNYVASHVAETDDGLYVVSTSAGWRVLVSSGGGDYVAGVFIVDPQGTIRQALTGSGITFSESMPFTIGGTSAFIQFDGNGHISIGGAGVSIAGGVTIGGSGKTLADAITAVEYGVGSSASSHSDITSWSTATPTWQEGRYVWQRTTNANGTYTYTCIQGAKGEQGETGPQGPQGETGEQGPKGDDGTSVTVKSSVTTYASSTSGTTAPSSGWQSTIPSVAQGSFLWTKVVTTFSDDSTATSYTASRQGSNGTSVTVSSVAYAYQLSTSGTTIPTGTWQTTPQAPTTTQFAWTRTTTTYSDGKTAVTYTVGGKVGANGTSYYTHIRYATDSSGSGMTATPTSATTYIGVYSGTSSTAPTTASSYTWSRYVGEKGDTGPEAVVSISPTAIDWSEGTATLKATLRVNGTVTTPTSYRWTKGDATTSLGVNQTLAVTDLNATYHCTCTW